MGMAIIVPNISFGTTSLGKVTPSKNVPLRSLSISGESSISSSDNAAQYSVIYSPADTNQRDVTWSITSGQEYAEISSNGKLSVKTGAASNNVKIKATSSNNPAIYAEKDVNVTYVDPSLNIKNALVTQNGGYVLTDIPISSTTRIIVDFESFSLPNSGSEIIGARDGSNNRRIYTEGAYIAASYGTKTPLYTNENFGVGTRCLIDSSPEKIVFNGTEFANTAQTFSSDIKIVLCASTEKRFAFKGKLYSAKFMEGENVIANFVPCLYHDEAGLYDLVGGKFYGNDEKQYGSYFIVE